MNELTSCSASSAIYQVCHISFGHNNNKKTKVFIFHALPYVSGITISMCRCRLERSLIFLVTVPENKLLLGPGSAWCDTWQFIPNTFYSHLHSQRSIRTLPLSKLCMRPCVSAISHGSGLICFHCSCK